VIRRRIQRIEDPPNTRRSAREVPAARAGLEQEDVEAIWTSVLNYYRLGLQPAMALCLRVRGEVILDRSVGHAQGNGPEASSIPCLEATPDTPFNLFSASKPITAMIVHGLVERGLLKLDEPVAKYLPEFDQADKRDITLRHVLSHRAGLPNVPAKIDLERVEDHAYIRSLLKDAPIDTKSGANSAYHALTGGYILWEIVRNVTGRCLRDFQREWVCEPMGFNYMNYGLKEAERRARAIDSWTGPPAIYPLSKTVKRALGVSLKEVVEVTNDPRFLGAVVPSANIFATANEACLYFEMLRRQGALNDKQIFQEETVAQAVAQAHFMEMDSVIRLPIGYGLGFMLGNPIMSLFGPRTPGVFGHLGFTNILVWADPERELSGAFLNNGKPFITPELLMWLNIPRTISARVPRRAIRT
jgi:CubicO group peptidase (beta-lactamase class C family)